ncbi:MAG: histidine kinase [Rubrivivax sp.]|nr:histidine kinase [Rubrivivax sp.]
MLWWAYAGMVLAIGGLLGLAELQRYLAAGGRHAWEPFLWELSSLAATGLLGPAVYRWHAAGLTRARWVQGARHALGALVYVMLHVAGMFGLRFAVYALTGVVYEPGSAAQILSYEAGKDLASYALIVAICHALWLYAQAQRRQQDLIRLRAELAEARLSRLAEQIQPHFLFNTLNLISSLMHENVERADRILCDLAQLLRQALAAQEAGTHSLAQELTLVEPYLAIMGERFGERLSVSVDVTKEARDCLLPALLLISPVENAIKHGVARSSEPVRVEVRGWVEAGVLHLSVANSGAAPERAHRGGALGLANLRERLHTLFGQAAAMQLTPGPDGGCVLSLQLPARQ